jgi:hypothetical protein
MSKHAHTDSKDWLCSDAHHINNVATLYKAENTKAGRQREIYAGTERVGDRLTESGLALLHLLPAIQFKPKQIADLVRPAGRDGEIGVELAR